MNKGDELDRDSIADHLQFCERKSRRTAVSYPWQRGFLAGDHFGGAAIFGKFGPIGMTPLIRYQPESVPELSQTNLLQSMCSALLCKQPQISWDSKLDAQRDSALMKWQKIILVDPMSFEVARAFFNSTKKGINFGRLVDDLRNIFASRSSNTLHSRSGPVLRYLAYCQNAQLSAFPLLEEQVYGYMQDVEQQSAPTYLRSFLSSLGFCLHVLGLTSAKAVLDSPRIKGLAMKCFLTKRKTQARWPLTVGELMTLENIVCGHTDKSVVDRHVAGCFLYMVYARARFSDMMNISKLSFDFVEKDGQQTGFIEAEVARSKTSFSVDRKVRLLPMTSTVQGVGVEPWGVAWKQVIEDAKVQVGAGKPLLPGRTPDGWHTLPLSAEAGTSWLRVLLQSDGMFDRNRLEHIGTHSCKCTCLSWLSKFGADAEVRRLMGYHVADRMSTMMIYGRDNTSAGLRLLNQIIQQIRIGEFVPDANRAGMFPQDTGRQPALVDDHHSDTSSEDSADESSPDHEIVEQAEAQIVGAWDGGVDVKALPAETLYFRHALSRIIHLVEDEGGSRFMCGRKIDRGYNKLPARPPTMIPLCKQCFAKFKLP